MINAKEARDITDQARISIKAREEAIKAEKRTQLLSVIEKLIENESSVGKCVLWLSSNVTGFPKHYGIEEHQLIAQSLQDAGYTVDIKEDNGYFKTVVSW